MFSTGAQPATRPTEHAKGLECSIRAVERDGKWFCETTIFNSSRELRTVPRGPREVLLEPMPFRTISKSTRATADGIEHSGVLVGPFGTAYTHVAEITLQPDEGIVQRRPLRPLEPGQYKLAIKLPRGFEDLNPDPITFTVAPR